LKNLLKRARLLYVPEVLREISAAADLATLRYRLPCFESFAAKV